MKFLANFHPPVGINDMKLGHKSGVYNKAQDFNIKEISVPRNAFRFFPKEVWQTLLPTEYHYTRITDAENEPSSWQKIFREWKHVWEESISTPHLFYQVSTDFLTITDTVSNNSSKCILKGIERKVYLFCDTIQTKENILKQFPDLSSDHLEEIVKVWIAHRWMFREADRFLSLAISLDPTMSPLAYLTQLIPYPDKYLTRWKSPPEKQQNGLKLDLIATLNFSKVLNKVSTGLKSLRGK